MKTLNWIRNNEPHLPSAFINGLPGFFNDDTFQKELSSTRPAVNIKETEDGYSLELAAPGFEKGDFKIDLDHDLLIVSVEKEKKSENEKEGYTRREFNYASFKRSFTLPNTVDREKIDGVYTNGILNVTLPKKEQEKKLKREISIR
ncbi:Hsp20/alpha crystallin family protein [soil metagenome]